MSRNVLPVSRSVNDSLDEAAGRTPTTARVEPLRKRTRGGKRMTRPAAVERELAKVIDWDVERVLGRAAIDDPEAEGYMSAETLVHLIRRDARDGTRELVDGLAPILLGRCARTLERSLTGFSGAAREDVRGEILGRLAELLVGPGDGADFYEVRFARAFKCLTIDVCRQERRRAARFPAAADLAAEDDESSALERLAAGRKASWVPSPETLADLGQALESLTEEERKVLVLYRLMGIPLAGRGAGGPTVIDLLGCSERTARNRLRRAEARLAAWREDRR